MIQLHHIHDYRVRNTVVSEDDRDSHSVHWIKDFAIVNENNGQRAFMCSGSVYEETLRHNLFHSRMARAKATKETK